MAYENLQEPTFVYAVIDAAVGMLTGSMSDRCHLFATEAAAEAQRSKMANVERLLVVPVLVVPVTEENTTEDDDMEDFGL